jgi:ABC-type phosphate/phosphonate transport system substrate-binding protein
MRRHRHWHLGYCAILAAVGLAGSTPASHGDTETPDLVRIGMVKTLFRDVPEPLVRMLSYPFNTLMKAQTGMDGQLVHGKDCLGLGRQLHENKVQLGVFHGIEFGWAREKYKDLRPLCIAINRHRNLQAYLLVRQDGTIHGMADLKGKVVALPRRSREHCHLFLESQCDTLGLPPAKFFSKIVNPPNVECALDDVLRGKSQAAVVDNVALESYHHVKPGCHARLKILHESAVFPAAVIAYCEGAMSKETLERFKQGMITANQNERGRELMNMWSLSAFEAIPDDYEQVMTDILRIYPAPNTMGTVRTSTVNPPAGSN